MTVEDVVREELDRWADEARTPSGLADRALGGRRRRRTRMIAVIAGAAAAVVVGALAVPGALRGGGEQTAIVLAGEGLTTDGPAVALPPSAEVSADPDASPPSRLVATPEVAMYAYSVWDYEKVSQSRQVFRRTWYLYNPAAAAYEKTPWAVVDVAAGGHVAVLEEQQASRVGVLSPTGRVRWVELEHPASTVEWSPDGSRLLLTGFASNPYEQGVVDEGGPSEIVEHVRTGFTVVDVGSGEARFRALESAPGQMGVTMLGWSGDGTLIWEPGPTSEQTKLFYDLQGRPHGAPPHEGETYQEAGLSPGRRSLAVDSPGRGAVVAVKDVASGTVTPLKPVAGHWIEQAVAWSGDGKLVTWACEQQGAANCRVSEFRNRLLLVDADGRAAVPLTGFRENSENPGAWEPLFARR
ncbi:hypothetical protein SAMN05421505_11865 [Sinosporangium album]|uniref:WD40-like Beta Propeller Repeat n=1 Tax=Sinosporangium album TaxID=504805 RepID=A0A1G8DIK2_9ACTN|nr:hypothetical protein [Sinosporangium album]SDH57484.1 hypothetical protein SAMN05421505_11865 [Sinosporangium album]